MTLSTLDIKKNILKYFYISAGTFIFGFIYELFSHDVYSKYMMYAFIIPLILGTFGYFIIYILKENKYLTNIGITIYNLSIITFTLGSIMKGVLEIYGTTNKLVSSYFIIGLILFILSILINIFYKERRLSI